MYCEYCGNQILPGYERCSTCNQLVLEENPDISQPFSEPSPLFLQPSPAASASQSQILGTLFARNSSVKPPRFFRFLYRLHCPFCSKKMHPSDCAIYS